MLHYSSHSCRTIHGFRVSEFNRELTWRLVLLVGGRASSAWRPDADDFLRRSGGRNVPVDRDPDGRDVHGVSRRSRRRAPPIRQARMVRARAQHVPVGERRGDGAICRSHPARLSRRAGRGGDLFHRGAHRQYFRDDFVGLEHLYRHPDQHIAFCRRNGRRCSMCCARS